jgi:hypothetical protein
LLIPFSSPAKALGCPNFCDTLRIAAEDRIAGIPRSAAVLGRAIPAD